MAEPESFSHSLCEFTFTSVKHLIFSGLCSFIGANILFLTKGLWLNCCSAYRRHTINTAKGRGTALKTSKSSIFYWILFIYCIFRSILPKMSRFAEIKREYWRAYWVKNGRNRWDQRVYCVIGILTTKNLL